MGLGTTTKAQITEILKDTFGPDDLKAAVYEESPLFGMIKKVDDFPGGTKNVTVQWGQSQGIGSTMAGAIDNISSNTYGKFAVTSADLYAVGRITGQAIRATRKNEAALVREVTQSQEGLLQQLRNEIGFSLFGNGGAARGQIKSISGSTITLYNNQQARMFEVDQKIQLSADDGVLGAGGAGVESGVLVVADVDALDGIITFTQAVTTGVPTAVVDMYLFRNSTYGALFGGLPMWVPRTQALASTTLFGCNRAKRPERLAGLRYKTGATIAETIIDALAWARTQGAMPKDLYMNPMAVAALVKSLDSKMVVDKAIAKASDMADVGYEGIRFKTSNGTVNVWEEPTCPLQDCWALTLDSWEYSTMDGFPDYLKEDDVEILRVAGEDSYEWRLGAFGQLICWKPYQNMYIPLPSFLS